MGFPAVGQPLYGVWTQQSEGSADLETRLTQRALSLMDAPFSAKGDGAIDDTAAIAAWAAAGAGKFLFVPKPAVSYKMTAKVVISANTVIIGTGRLLSLFSKAFNGDMFELGAGVRLLEIGLVGNGATFTGRGFIITGGNGQIIADCDARDMEGYTVEFTVPGAGSNARVYGGTHLRTNFAAAGVYAIKCPAGESLSNPGTPRYFGPMDGGGSALVDFADCGDAWLNKSFPRNVNFGRDAAIVNLGDCRIASLGEPLYIDGGGHIIHDNAIAGPAIFAGNGLAGGGSKYSGNSHTSLHAPNAKYCEIDHDVQFMTNEPVATTGAITTGTNKLVCASSAGFFTGQYVTVAGAGVAGAQLRSMVIGVGVAGAIYLQNNASTTVAGAAVNGSMVMLTDGVLVPTANTTAGSPVIVVSSAAGIALGQPVLVQNADRSGLNFLSVVIAIAGTSITLAHNMEQTLVGTGTVFMGPALDPGVGGYVRIEYTRRGSQAHVNFDMLIGTGSSLGAGAVAWHIMLPYLAYPSNTNHRFSLIANDISATTDYLCRGTIDPGTIAPTLNIPGGAANVRAGAPFVWAQNDSVRGEFTYAVH